MSGSSFRYLVVRARVGQPQSPASFRGLAAAWSEACRSSGAVPWGLFSGLLGLRTDEMFAVAAAPDAAERPGLPGAETLDRYVGTATARPLAPEPQQTPGVYVFRRFQIATASVEEFLRLSVEAWETFENDPAFQAEPRALLRSDLPGGLTHMMLITWYADLASWERSRQPAPAARENFQARARLTHWALPIATRLA
ncbi:MAG: hypothetical protein KatS3mg062_0387 [Tepidiforma sp.]|nr:MAG: hypothetical protein KatS3mg062_0387 [Tepidiforma sp.]